jgi:1-deoxy-D-xylulose-5-phosphate synthase
MILLVLGHSSTSISAAIGMAIASSYKKENKKDSSSNWRWRTKCRNGFEALNHMGSIDEDMLVILK